MIKKILLPMLLASFVVGCNTTTKDDKYNAMSANEIYQLGVTHTQKRNYQDAVEDFHALESRYPFGEYADKAQLGAIYAYFENGDYATAIPAIDRFIRMNPRHPHVDYAHYMKGLSHYMMTLGFFGKYFPALRADRDQTDGKKAYESFLYLVQAYPYSTYTPDAKQRMLYLRDLLAEHELAVARFYLKKGVYLAAANRANYIVAHFDQSPKVPEALGIMVCAYRALDLPKHENDAARILALSYPDSIFNAN